MTVTAAPHSEYKVVFAPIVKVCPGRYLVPVEQTVGPELLSVVHQPRNTSPVNARFEFPRTVTVELGKYGELGSVGGVPLVTLELLLVLLL